MVSKAKLLVAVFSLGLACLTAFPLVARAHPTGLGIIYTPSVYDFGQVEIGSKRSAIVTLSTGLDSTCLGCHNADDQYPVSIEALDSCGNCHGPLDGYFCQEAFSIQPVDPLPVTLSPGDTLDVMITFTPMSEVSCKEGVFSLSGDAHDPLYAVLTLSGSGVRAEPPPADQILQILAKLGECFASGTCSGSGSGNSSGGRLGAFRNMVEASGDLIDEGRIADACRQLADAYNRTDGQDKPPDFIEGNAADDLANMIQTLRESLGCQ